MGNEPWLWFRNTDERAEPIAPAARGDRPYARLQFAPDWRAQARAEISKAATMTPERGVLRTLIARRRPPATRHSRSPLPNHYPARRPTFWKPPPIGASTSDATRLAGGARALESGNRYDERAKQQILSASLPNWRRDLGQTWRDGLQGRATNKKRSDRAPLNFPAQCP
jgi:hypothetical protein